MNIKTRLFSEFHCAVFGVNTVLAVGKRLDREIPKVFTVKSHRVRDHYQDYGFFEVRIAQHVKGRIDSSNSCKLLKNTDFDSISHQ